MFSCQCLNVFRPTQRLSFSRGPSLLCSDNSVRESQSADADSKLYDFDHVPAFGWERSYKVSITLLFVVNFYVA